MGSADHRVSVRQKKGLSTSADKRTSVARTDVIRGCFGLYVAVTDRFQGAIKGAPVPGGQVHLALTRYTPAKALSKSFTTRLLVSFIEELFLSRAADATHQRHKSNNFSTDELMIFEKQKNKYIIKLLHISAVDIIKVFH